MKWLGTDYRKLWVGNAISNLGDGVTFVAIPLLAAMLTKDPIMVAGLSTAYTLPRLFAALFSGALVDRLDRRYLMYAGNFGRAAVMGMLGLCVVLDFAGIWLLYIVFIVMGLLETVTDSSAFSILPSVVKDEDLEKANSQLTTAQLVNDEFVGPPLGGLLFGLGAALPIFFDAASFAVAGLCFLALRGSFGGHVKPAEERGSIRRDIKEGVAWLMGRRLLRGLTVMFAFTNLAYMIPWSVLVLFAQQRLQLSEVEYGLMLAVSALGGLLGTALAPKIRRRLGLAWSVCGSLLVGAVSYLVMAVSSSAVLVAVMLAAYIFYTVVWGVAVASTAQRLVPDELRGRAGSVNRLMGLLGMAAGSLLGGVIVKVWGVVAPFWIAGVVLALTAIVFLPLMLRWEEGPAEEDHSDSHLSDSRS